MRTGVTPKKAMLYLRDAFAPQLVGVALAGLLIFSEDVRPQIPATGVVQRKLPDESRNATDAAKTISLAGAVDLALRQASAYINAQLNEKIAAEDVRQARAAFMPKITAPLTLIYTTPSIKAGAPREPSFISADAVSVYQVLLNASGDVDISGRLRAMVRRNRALLESAHAGTAVARRELIQAVVDAYFGLALSTTKRRGAESNVQAAIEFEENTRLQLEAGEVAPVDLVRSRLQTAVRRDELAQARTDETVNGDSLRMLIGGDFGEPIATEDLLTKMPVPDEIQRFSEAAIHTRPEFAQYESDRRAAEAEISAARSERRPQMAYSLSPGFITDSLSPVPVREHSGVQATVSLTIPIFDWGTSRSRETQARLRMQQLENSHKLAERQFVQAFYTSRTQALSAEDRIVQLNRSIADAENNVSASIARYRAGEGPITEVIDAQNLLVTQRQLLYQAIFDYQTAKSRLARAVGQ